MLHLITHNGKFHIGDVASTALLRIVAEVHGYENSKTWRINDRMLGYWRSSGILWDQDRLLRDVDNNTVAKCIVYDIGDGRFSYDAQDILYHNNTNLTIPKAAFGLLWDEYGNGLAGDFASEFERDIVIPIDVSDLTGESNHLSFLIDKYMSDTNGEYDNMRFESAVSCLYDLFKNKINKLKRRSDAHIELNSYIELLNSINRAVEHNNEVVYLSFEYDWRERDIRWLDEAGIKLVAMLSSSSGKIYVECVHGTLPPYLLGLNADKCSLAEEDFNNISIIDSCSFYMDSEELSINGILCSIAQDMEVSPDITKDKLETATYDFDYKNELKTLEFIKDTPIATTDEVSE